MNRYSFQLIEHKDRFCGLCGGTYDIDSTQCINENREHVTTPTGVKLKNPCREIMMGDEFASWSQAAQAVERFGEASRRLQTAIFIFGQANE